MNTKIEKSKFIQYIPFIVLFLIFIIIQINLKPVADDIWFYNILRTNQYDNIIEFLIGRYYNWSSRLIIEMNIIFLVNLPDIIWKSLNSLIFVLIAYLTSKFFKNKYSFKNKNIINYSIASILVLILFFVSYHAISTCGWITVPLNYIWIIFFLLLHFYLLKEYISKEKLKTKSQNIIVYFLLFYSLIYVCNHEQGLIIFFIIYLLLISYNLIKKNRIHNIIYLLGFLILIMGSISFFSPGNHARSLVEARYFPGFSEFGVLTKVDIGLSSLFRLFIADNNLIALLFLLVFGIYNYFISKKTRIICLIPFISCFILNLLVYFNIFNISNLVI